MRGNVRVEITPMFKQYFEIKNKYPDTILFFRLGDFYEMFFEDAETVAPLLGLVLTKREAGKNLIAPMCGVPADKSSIYIQKLVDMGFKVAICEQVEDPAEAKGLVRREVVKIYTPGLLIDLESLSEKEKNYLASLFIDRKAGCSFLELSCGEFIFTELQKEEILSEILKKEPKEIILNKKLENSELVKVLKQNIPKAHLSFVEEGFFKKEGLKEFNLEIFEFEKYDEGLKAANAILEYLKIYQPHLVDKIEIPQFYYPEEFLFLDESTKRNLELIKNLWDGSEKYTLFWVLDKTQTPMGARLLKEWILYPLKDIKKIQERQEVVKFFVENRALREDLRKILRKISDLERLSTRCALKLANPKELGLLRESLKYLPEIKSILEKEKLLLFPKKLEELLKNIEDFSELYELLSNWLVEDPPATLKEGGIIKRGINTYLDELLDLKENAIYYLSQLEKSEKEKTGITNLRIGYNKVFGYYFEVSKSYLKKVPSYFERKQTLTNVERFITPQLKELENKILSAEEKIKNLEYELFLELREKVSSYKEKLKNTAKALAELDVLISFSQVAIENNYIPPEIVEEPGLMIEAGRHPVLEKIQGKEKFVPNSLVMERENSQFLIITGPNMGGKST
ncbi:MAG: DNA mismatch repair protein MutS, partial [Thermodesulfobacterium geofontis]